jgi:hypothetical protein
MRDLDQLSEEDRKVVVSLMDAYLKKMQFEKMIAN